MAEPATLYKLMVLYMLDNVEFPLTNAQITNFFLEKEYTDYFSIQQTIHELDSSDLLSIESTQKNTLYRITPAGKETLKFFQDKISVSAMEDIRCYCKEHEMTMKAGNAYLSDYYKASDQSYAVRCLVREHGVNRMDLTLMVKNKEQAEAICLNWQEQASDVFACLMDMLVK